MALEEVGIGDAVRTVIETSRKHWELRGDGEILDTNTNATPVDEPGSDAGSAPGIETI